MNIKLHTTHKQHLCKIPLLAVLLSIFLMSLVSKKANAQDRTITLQEAIKLGLDNSKVLKLSQSKIDQAVSQYNQAKDRALPSGSVSLTYDRAEIPANKLDFGPS